MHEFPSNVPLLFYGVGFSPSMAVKILEAYEGTLEKNSPTNDERYEHNEMLLYEVNMWNHSCNPKVYVLSYS
jgi:peptide alpha-N-acetyltransferase